VHHPRRKPNPSIRHEEAAPGMSLACRARPHRGWLHAVLALGASAHSPAEPSACLRQISVPATRCIPKGRGLRDGNSMARHPHLSHPRGVSGRTHRKIQVGRDLQGKSKGRACSIHRHFWGWGTGRVALVGFGHEPWRMSCKYPLW